MIRKVKVWFWFFEMHRAFDAYRFWTALERFFKRMAMHQLRDVQYAEGKLNDLRNNATRHGTSRDQEVR